MKRLALLVGLMALPAAAQEVPPILQLDPTPDALRMIAPASVDAVLVPAAGTDCDTPAPLPGMPALMLWSMLREITRVMPPPAEIMAGSGCAARATADEAARSLGLARPGPSQAALPQSDGVWRLLVLSEDEAASLLGARAPAGQLTLVSRTTGQPMATISMRMRGMP